VRILKPTWKLVDESQWDIPDDVREFMVQTLLERAMAGQGEEMIIEVQTIGDEHIYMSNEEARTLAACLTQAADEATDHEMSFPIGVLSMPEENEEEKKAATITFWIRPKEAK